MTKKLYGYSLIELLIALSLSVILLSGLVEVYLSVKNTYQKQTALSRLQENARLASIILTKNISMAGFVGCNSKDFSDAIIGDNNKITIKKADENLTYLTEDFLPNTNIIKVENNPADKNNPELVIADCSHYDLFDSLKFGEKIIEANKNFKHHYHKLDTTVSSFEKTEYFIDKTSRKSKSGNPIYALYDRVNNGRKQELIENVNAMQIKYSIGNSYLSADQISNWEKVLSVFITLKLLEDNNKERLWKIYIALKERY